VLQCWCVMQKSSSLDVGVSCRSQVHGMVVHDVEVTCNGFLCTMHKLCALDVSAHYKNCVH
jgi:hypothetical protein